MTDYATATGAGIQVQALKREWHLSPLTFRSWGDLEQWMRTTTVRFARDAADGCSKTERDEIYQAAIRQAQMISFIHAQEGPEGAVELARNKIISEAKRTIDSGELDESGLLDLIKELAEAVSTQVMSQSPEAKVVQSLLSSPAGLLKIFHLSLSVQHRGVSEDRATEIALQMEEDLAEVASQIMEMSQRSTDRGEKRSDPQKDDQT